MADHAVKRYEFDDWQLDPVERQLLRRGEPIPLTPKVFDILLVLVERAGRLVAKEEFMSRVWPDVFVEDAVLTQNISQLRKLLGDPQAIETIPKKGYRFLKPVKAITDAPLEPQAKESAPEEATSSKTIRKKIWLISACILLLALSLMIGLAYFRNRNRHASASHTIRSLAVLPLATHVLAMSGLYCATLVVVAYLTQAKLHRIAGALTGAAVFGVVAMLALGWGQNYGWWRVQQSGSFHFRLLLWLSLAFSCAPVYLITWRVARRFGGRGLAVFAFAAAVVGPVRDYQVVKIFPSWIAFSPGIAPILAVALIYSALIVLGHAVMRTVSGPARNDFLAQWHIGAARKSSH